MSIPVLVKQLVEKKVTAFCKNRIPPHARHQIRMTFKLRGNHVTLFEERPLYQDPSQWTKMPIAQFRYNPETGEWMLYWKDRDEKWNEYWDFEPSKDLDDLIREVDEDPTHIFWG